MTSICKSKNGAAQALTAMCLRVPNSTAMSSATAIAASVSATARALISPLRIVSGVEIRCITAGRLG